MRIRLKYIYLYMNCFGNNNPNISSSDRTRDLEAKTIYNTSGDSLVALYGTGKIRSVVNYGSKHLIQHGRALCSSNVTDTKYVFGKDSIYNVFSPGAADKWIVSTDNRFILGIPNDLKSNPEYENMWTNKFGAEPRRVYTDIDSIIGHVDGSQLPTSSIIIDPNNELTGSELCMFRVERKRGTLKYLKHVKVKPNKQVTRQNYIASYDTNLGKTYL